MTSAWPDGALHSAIARCLRPIRSSRVVRSCAWAGSSAFVVALTGCGSGSAAPAAVSSTPTIAPPSPQALEAVTRAASTTQAQTASVSLRLEAAKVFGAASQPVTGSGAFDFRTGTGQAVLNQPSGAETVIFEPASVFVRQPSTGGSPGASALPRGKTWISAGLTESPTLRTNFPQFVVQAEGTNPVFLLDQVAWGAVSAAPLGRDTVAGGPAQGYLVEVDLTRAAAGAAGPPGAAFARAIGYEVTALGSTSASTASLVEMRVWVDGGGRVVRIQASPPGSGVGVTTVDMTAFGGAVRVSAPPTSRVADIVSLAPGGERENNGGGDSDGA